MQLNTLLQDEDAVSPVIGVILMVAITVILAAVIGTFVLGLGGQVQNSAPNANFDFEYTNMDTSSGTIDITHNGGQPVEVDNVQVQIGSDSYDPSADFETNWPTRISTGDTATYDEGDGGNNYTGGETVRIIWQSADGSSSNTIGQSTVPN